MCDCEYRNHKGIACGAEGCHCHDEVTGFGWCKDDQNAIWHREDTLHLVYKALRTVGLDHKKSIEAVGEMQREGIYFREMKPE